MKLKVLEDPKASAQETKKQTQFDLLPNKPRVSLWQVGQTFKNCEKRKAATGLAWPGGK